MGFAASGRPTAEPANNFDKVASSHCLPLRLRTMHRIGLRRMNKIVIKLRVSTSALNDCRPVAEKRQDLCFQFYSFFLGGALTNLLATHGLQCSILTFLPRLWPGSPASRASLFECPLKRPCLDFHQASTLYFLNQSIIRFQASSAASLR